MDCSQSPPEGREIGDGARPEVFLSGFRVNRSIGNDSRHQSIFVDHGRATQSADLGGDEPFLTENAGADGFVLLVFVSLLRHVLLRIGPTHRIEPFTGLQGCSPQFQRLYMRIVFLGRERQLVIEREVRGCDHLASIHIQKLVERYSLGLYLPGKHRPFLDSALQVQVVQSLDALDLQGRQHMLGACGEDLAVVLEQKLAGEIQVMPGVAAGKMVRERDQKSFLVRCFFLR